MIVYIASESSDIQQAQQQSIQQNEVSVARDEVEGAEQHLSLNPYYWVDRRPLLNINTMLLIDSCEQAVQYQDLNSHPKCQSRGFPLEFRNQPRSGAEPTPHSNGRPNTKNDYHRWVWKRLSSGLAIDHAATHYYCVLQGCLPCGCAMRLFLPPSFLRRR